MKSIKEAFGNKVRVRVCGLCFKDEAILLIKHNIDGQILWAPPGGGLDFGESIEHTLIREFKEETSLDVIPGDFLFFDEFIKTPLHALELFYKIESYTGQISSGHDPEIPGNKIIEDVGFFSRSQIKLMPQEQLHGILKICNSPLDLLQIQGHIK